MCKTGLVEMLSFRIRLRHAITYGVDRNYLVRKTVNTYFVTDLFLICFSFVFSLHQCSTQYLNRAMSNPKCVF